MKMILIFYEWYAAENTLNRNMWYTLLKNYSASWKIIENICLLDNLVFASYA